MEVSNTGSNETARLDSEVLNGGDGDNNEQINSRMRRRMANTRVKRKLDKNTTLDDLLNGWTQCCFLMVKKSKLCNLDRVPGLKFCGAHSSEAGKEGIVNVVNDDSESLSKRTKKLSDKSRERIPCPLDPKHTVYTRRLEEHLKICTAIKQQDELKATPYFCQDCNAGPLYQTQTNNEEEQDTTNMDTIDLKQLIDKIDYIYNTLLPKDMSSPRVFTTPEKNQSWYENSAQKIREVVGKDQQSFSQLRHIDQDIAIVHCMREYELFTTTNHNIYIEFGAGKGLLAQAIACSYDHNNDIVKNDNNVTCHEHLKFLLIERASNRKKIDRRLKDDGYIVQRIRMDIQHCLLPSIPLIQDTLQVNHNDTNITVVAKHLCGMASDLAIFSLSSTKQTLSHQEAAAPNVHYGLAVATCCHHACRYDQYAGIKWLTEVAQIRTKEEFRILRSWSGWAHLDRSNRVDLDKTINSSTENDSNAKKAEDDDEEDNDNVNEHAVPATNPNDKDYRWKRPDFLTTIEMAKIGKQIKRILDYGRIMYLRDEQGMEVDYLQYCSTELSPECMIILARSK